MGIRMERLNGEIVERRDIRSSLVADQSDRTLVGVDKVFLAYLDGHPAFIGGFRTLLPADSEDAKRGRNHGTGPTIWAQIVGNSSRFSG